MNLFEVTSVYQQSMYGWNGIIGLAPDQDGAPPSFVKSMKDASLITDAKMCFWLQEYSVDTMSSVTFGGTPDGAWKGKPIVHDVVKNLNT